MGLIYSPFLVLYIGRASHPKFPIAFEGAERFLLVGLCEATPYASFQASNFCSTFQLQRNTLKHPQTWMLSHSAGRPRGVESSKLRKNTPSPSPSSPSSASAHITTASSISNLQPFDSAGRSACRRLLRDLGRMPTKESTASRPKIVYRAHPLECG